MQMKIFELKVQEVEDMPREKEHGILYISEKHKLAIHLCACGCGIQTVTPFRRMFMGAEKGWTVEKTAEGVTLRPSIGNFLGESPYHAHYYVTNSKIDWLD